MLLQTLKGFRDFDPQELSLRKKVIETLSHTFERFGFVEIATPALEYQEILLGKYGADAEKLMYLFEDPGGRAVGLKYDLTVPLARYMANHPQTPIPFKRYQIQPVWRAENTQRGRFREFYQCDLDTIGSNSPFSDAEILAITSLCLKNLEISDFTILVNSREVLFSVMEKSGITKDLWLNVILSLDKLDKKSVDEVSQELSEKGLKSEEILNVFSNLKKSTPDDYLTQVLETAKSLGAINIEFSPTISRGLDYYTGPIFESVTTTKIGSITGGGRYDHLLKDLGGPDLPAVGTTFGIDRIVELLKDKDQTRSGAQVLVTVFSDELLTRSIEVANILRSHNIKTEIYLSATKLDKQLKYANKKQIPFVVVLGPDEISKNQMTLKNMKDGSEEKVSGEEELVEKVKYEIR